MRFELFVGGRYFLSLQKEKFISVISLISSLGVAIGVMALIIVIAVMAGFDNDLKDKIIGSNPHIIIHSEDGIKDYPAFSAKIRSLKGVEGVAPYVSGQAFLYFKDRFLSLNIKGIDLEAEKKVTKIRDYVLGSDVSLPPGGILLGEELTNALGIKEGDEVVLSSPLIGLNTPFHVSGIFHTGMYDYDFSLGFVDIRDAQKFFGLENFVTQAGVKLKDPYQARALKKELEAVIGLTFHVRTWTEINKNFFAALELEKMTMFVILTLIVLVACFNIISTLVVMVVEKTKDIGILKAIGVTQRSVQRIFTWGGLIIGFSGTVFGIICGVVLCFLLKRYQFIQLPKDIYSIDRLPVFLRWQDVGLIALCALVISFLSTIYPAFKAARLDPVEALRYE